MGSRKFAVNVGNVSENAMKQDVDSSSYNKTPKKDKYINFR